MPGPVGRHLRFPICPHLPPPPLSHGQLLTVTVTGSRAPDILELATARMSCSPHIYFVCPRCSYLYKSCAKSLLPLPHPHPLPHPLALYLCHSHSECRRLRHGHVASYQLFSHTVKGFARLPVCQTCSSWRVKSALKRPDELAETLKTPSPASQFSPELEQRTHADKGWCSNKNQMEEDFFTAKQKQRVS